MRVVKEAVIACMEQVMTVLCEMEENPDVMDSELDGGPAPTTSGGWDEELLNDLNEIFTPIPVTIGSTRMEKLSIKTINIKRFKTIKYI